MQTYLKKYYAEELNKNNKSSDAQLAQQIKSKSIKELMKGARDAFFKHHNHEDLTRVLNITSIKKNVISCQFSSDFCNENDFEAFMLYDFMKCYRFNGGKNMVGNITEIKNARRYGKSYGLQMELYVGKPDSCKSPLGNLLNIF